MFFGDESYVGPLDQAGALDVDVVTPVDHHLADRGVVEKLLDRTEAHHVAGDVLHEQLPLLRSQHGFRRVHQGADLGHDERLHLLFGRRLEETATEPLEERVVYPGLEVAQAVGRKRLDRGPSPGVSDLASLDSGLLRLQDAFADSHRRQPFLAGQGIDRRIQQGKLLQLIGDR